MRPKPRPRPLRSPGHLSPCRVQCAGRRNLRPERSYRRTMTDRDDSSPDDEVRLPELAEFLRERRARLDPEQLGLPARRRRRTPGLRREDVAERAAVSVAWYASLEQGRPVNPSKAVVSSLANALCLSEVDRAYLFKLAGHPAPPITELAGLDAHLLQALVDHIAAPAYWTGALTNVMAWNGAACSIFGDSAH